MDISKDDELQRKYAVEAFLESKKPFQDELDNLAVFAEELVKGVIEGGAVDANELQVLNYNLGYKAAITAVLNSIKGLTEELVGPDVKGNK